MKTLKRAMIWSVGTMVMTIIHHLYGAMIYDEPFRLHAAIFAMPVIVILLISYTSYQNGHNTRIRNSSRTIFIVVSVLFSVGTIGIYEGGYNHLLKNLLYFGGISIETLDRMYPSIYELPNNFLFEATGIMQLMTGILCAREILKSLIKWKFDIVD